MGQQNERGGRQPELHAGPAQPRRVGVQPGEDRAGGGDGGHRRGSAGGVQEGWGRQEIKRWGYLRYLKVIGSLVIFYLLHIYKIRAFLLINQIICRQKYRYNFF